MAAMQSPPDGPAVAVIGGGVSGLATARFLAARTASRTVLLEAGPTLGGKVRTAPLAGLPLESGPDGFLAEPAVVALCEEVGLGARMIESATTEAHLWDGDRLRPLRAEDTRGGQAPPPRFLSIRGGLERLVEALADGLPGVDVRLRAKANCVHRAGDGSLVVDLDAGPPVRAAGVVLAVPAPEAAALVSRSLPDVAAALRRVRYLDLAVINLVYPGRPWCLRGSGFLASERAAGLVSGCTWLSVKWPQLAHDDRTAVRVTVGGRGGADWKGMTDAELVDVASQELTRVLGPAPAPEWTRVVRWDAAIADPRSLDRELVRGAQREARRAGVLLAAGGYLGGGLASCVADAERAADGLRLDLVPPEPRAHASSGEPA